MKRILENVLPNVCEFCLVADNVFVVIALPKTPKKGTPVIMVNAFAISRCG